MDPSFIVHTWKRQDAFSKYCALHSKHCQTMLTCLNICVVMWRSGSGCTNSSFHRYTQITSIFNYFCSSSWPYSNMLIWCWHWPGYLHIYKPRYLQMAAFISLQCWRCTRSLLLAHHHCHCTVHITKLCPKAAESVRWWASVTKLKPWEQRTIMG